MSTTVFRHDWTKVADDTQWQPHAQSTRRARAGERSKAVPEHARLFVPPGWPEQVEPPCQPDWELSAVSFLFDCCPPDYRGYPVLRRHPVVLARLAAQSVEAQVRACRESIAQARQGLSDYVDAPVLDSTVEVLQSEEARLSLLRRAVMLVEESLRGRVFISRL